MEKNLAVTERRRDVIIESGDVLTEGKFMLSLTLLPAASFITFMGTGDLGFMLLMIPAIVPGPLGLIGLQWILSKKYKNKKQLPHTVYQKKLNRLFMLRVR